jgi:predicted nuclease of restriction endonuclease-like (RecB) superfamily
MIEVDKNYQLVLKQLVEKITGSRYKVTQVANTELLSTYWEIGRTLLEQKEKAGWGKKIIEKLANDLKAKFPNMRGLSQRNLEYMQTFASTWPFFPIPQPAAAELSTINNTDDPPILQQPAAKLQNTENHNTIDQQPLLFQIPWTHHMIILDKANTPDERIFYIKEAIRNGWSRNMLKINIETCLYKRKGNAITNFDSKLSENQAELARLTLKNPYIFDFLDIEAPMHERDLERALIKHIQRFQRTCLQP